MTLGQDWHYGQPVAGFYASEKLDGVRAYWDGFRFWTRSGRCITAPESITANLPHTPLDGEIWAGRGEFIAARNAANHGHWLPVVRFVAFDAPQAAGDWLARLASIPEGVNKVEGFKVTGTGDVCFHVSRIVREGGEGLVLRQPGVGYVTGRTASMLKAKPS